MKECLYCEDSKVLSAGQVCECRLHKLVHTYQRRAESLHNVIQSWKLANVTVGGEKIEQLILSIDQEHPLL